MKTKQDYYDRALSLVIDAAYDHANCLDRIGRVSTARMIRNAADLVSEAPEFEEPPVLLG